MEESQSFTIAVGFKIHTNDIVDVAPGMAKPTPAKVTTGRKKPPPTPQFTVIDSSDFNDGLVLDSKVFMYGKSLKEFKDLVGNVCDLYFPGIKKVVLESALAPLLTWNATVGSKKTKLTDYKNYQDFFNNLGKSRSLKGTVNIVLEKPQVKAKKTAQATSAVAFIKGTVDPNSIEGALAASKEELAEAKEETARDGYTTRAIPPSTTEYKKEMAKNQMNHLATNVDNRVKKRYLVAMPAAQASSSQAKHRNFFANPPAGDVKVKIESESPSGSKRALERTSSSLTSVTSIKKIKQESSLGDLATKPISLLTDEDVPETVVYASDSDVEYVVTHSTLLDDFLSACEVPRNDLATRKILRKANVVSWTDLVPSVQMTANVLTGHGMPFYMAQRLLTSAAEAHAQQESSTPAE
ncbi:uncharacterized protein MELLADRAFT_67693 [Melampsora larici-populina 98AG31]|uniref:Uncharacterized protein n=1 Tax=Melampsora larici-populina (strain 98AG31 / pathotype 3-4-7) TaxID=747676 RepID=F4S429_MELLP|nr:uncharacterized protein MELLADRAFT_67693 [Melampsora larici-populina 98AG31]EGG00638.1 hypothetical protein MELLADRAFT_67693 [Melampsora larici-populina 98AG31]